MNSILLLILACALSGCSVAALVQNDNLDKRIQSLEARVHALETTTPASR